MTTNKFQRNEMKYVLLTAFAFVLDCVNFAGEEYFFRFVSFHAQSSAECIGNFCTIYRKCYVDQKVT